jgi:uncharacterized protein YndB with AHSA1/START domain
MRKRSTHPATFVIERYFAASPAQVFAAWAEPKARARWFVGPDEWEKSDHKLDFRVGGRESVSGGPSGGPVHVFNAVYQDIAPNERIVYTYDMHLDKWRISVSLATVELKLAKSGTRMIFTEQAVFLDGIDTPAAREQDTRDLLDNLDADLRRQPATARVSNLRFTVLKLGNGEIF